MRCHLCGSLQYGPPHLLKEWKCLNNDCEIGLANLESRIIENGKRDEAIANFLGETFHPRHYQGKAY